MAYNHRGKPVPAPRPGSNTENSRSPQLAGHHGPNYGVKTKSPQPAPHQQHGQQDRPMPSQIMEAAIAGMNAHHNHPNEAKAKTVLKEAVDAVVNSFAKHSHGYGRGNINMGN